jgi:human immunodeficiency virus type I enhancer-binding protein
VKATSKDQLITSTSSSLSSSPLSSSATTIASTVTNTSALINNTTNDSKYLHKKFKKFCATVDSNQQQTNNISNSNINNNNNNINSHSSDNKATIIASTSITTTISTSAVGLLNNNNSEIVENKNSSWTPHEISLKSRHQQQTVPSPPPKHFQTTEEEKQLVKDIIDINNENFMHQSANHSLTLQNPSSFLITNSSSGPLVTVTTLGNHNSNFQPSGDIRHKVIGNSQEATFNQTPNGANFLIINNQLSASDYNQQQSSNTAVTVAPAISTVPTPTSSSSTPGRYICPYCQLNCAKPSVLQKHIRAHTNERPYPCLPCGFAFKTKSNLYKHCR